MSTPLASEDSLLALRDATDTFGRLIAEADESAEVSTCPGWTVRDLGEHLGTVHRWAAGILLSGEIHRRVTPVIEKPLPEWYHESAAELSAAIVAVAPDTPIPNFTRTNQIAAFWPRRQLHETIVHLRDLTLAMHLPDVPCSPEIAADGIDELFEVSFRVLKARETPPQVREHIRIHATDTGDEWVLSADAPGQLADVQTVCRASISGTASDLYFALWGRLPHETLAVQGDAAAEFLTGPISV
jgi:uncharacterized protein (TIGR03083 family)